MLPATSPRKKLKSPGQDTLPNPKTTITCTNVPESLFEPNAALKHFSKFGKVHKIKLISKKKACMIEYEQPSSTERAVLNAGAYDGFMFDVTRTKARVRKRSKREDDPDWVPDSEVAQELSAMRGAPTYNTRRKSTDTEFERTSSKPLKRVIQQTVRKAPVRKLQTVRQAKPPVKQAQPTPVQPSGIESPVIVTTQNTMTTFEAASELHQLRAKISLSADEQWRTLDARDRILRSWGGAGSRVKVGGATIGTCQEMCPEKELLHRMAEHQVMILETDSEGVLEPRRAVKQYSRSSADQEMPMCFELRPAHVLMRTCSYLLHEVADTSRQISLADWFHFMWDRLRGIRKDITQQAMCCAESICLVEMCARFHAHCAARLADLEHTQFDQKLNTDNLTKCLQTLKHMYYDVTAERKPREAEFRGYIALLNLGDANFWWEIKQLPVEIQKSPPLIFAIKVFNALDNNNYVRFFRLVREEATYLQACILLRYFNDVRARALARIVKAYAPRGGSRFPASDLVSALAFESTDKMKAFISHYGLRFAKADDYELSVILDRNQFIEDSDPFPTARALQLIESKRDSTVGNIIAGGELPLANYFEHNLHSSFTKEGRLKETALVAEEQGFNTLNDSNKNVEALKAEIQRLAKGGKAYTESIEQKTLFVKPDMKTLSPRRKANPVSDSKQFTFKPAITVAPAEIIQNSPEKTFDLVDNVFSFSKPQVTEKVPNFFTPPTAKSTDVFKDKTLSEPKSIFSRITIENKTPFQNSQNAFGGTNETMITKLETKSAFTDATKQNVFAKPEIAKPAFSGGMRASSNLFSKPEPSIFGQNIENKHEKPFTGAKPSENLFSKPDLPKSVFGQNFTELTKESAFGIKSNDNLFSNPEIPPSMFGQNVAKDSIKPSDNIFSKPEISKSVFGQNIMQNTEKNSSNVFGIRSSSISNNTENKATFNQNIFASAKNDLATSKADSAIQFGKGSSIFAKASNPEESQGTNIFTKPMQNIDESQSGNIFAKPASEQQSSQSSNIFAKIVQQNRGEPKPGNNLFAKPTIIEEFKPSNIFGVANQSETRNIFAKPEVLAEQPIFASNGDVSADKTSPGSLFKSAINPPNGSDVKAYSIFQSKNKAQTVADNIFNSLNTAKNDSIYDFQHNTEIGEQSQLELQILREERMKQEQIQRQEKIKKEEERKQAELRKQEEERRKAEEERRKAEDKRKQKELRRLEEKRRLEEQRKQEELRKKLEEERKAELKQKAEEEHRKFLEAVNKESSELVEELITEVNNETSRELLGDEQDNFRQLLKLAGDTNEEIITELCNEICYSEMKAEVYLTRSIMRKWFDMWRRQLVRNLTRRRWLDDTPVWLPNRSPIEQASLLRRKVEDATLQNMNAFHRGYKFSGELKQIPPPDPYDILEIIRSPLLKRMKQVSYPYDKCFFWKVTLVSPGENQWLCRKINIEKWLHDAFSDNKKHEESETLLHVVKQSWNCLMDFAISVSLVKRENMTTCAEAVEGTNGVLFYSTENDFDLLQTIEQTLKNLYPFQVIPVAVILPKLDDAAYNAVQTLLTDFVNRKIISGYKVFILDPKSINNLMNTSTKSALKWMAKKFPQTPPLEIDFLKSICQRYLGNEIWCRFRSERDNRMGEVLKDLQKLINCYNVAVDKLTDVITNEELFNYTSFPLELKPFLEQASPYPKPFEFIPSSARTSENISTIRDIMKQLKLPNTLSAFRPLSAVSMQQQIRTYCNQIGWFEDPEEVVCKVVAILPHELSDLTMPCEDFTQYFAHYDLIDFLNVIIYEKIKRLYNFDNRFAIYEKSVLQEYCNINWLYEVKTMSEIKHKAIEYEDDVNNFIKAKRRKIAMDSLEYLMLEDKDSTLVEASIQDAEVEISRYSDCSEAVKQLEKEIDEGTKKSVEFENMLRAALANV